MRPVESAVFRWAQRSSKAAGLPTLSRNSTIGSPKTSTRIGRFLSSPDSAAIYQKFLSDMLIACELGARTSRVPVNNLVVTVQWQIRVSFTLSAVPANLYLKSGGIFA